MNDRYQCDICSGFSYNDLSFQLHMIGHDLEEAATEQGDDTCDNPGCTAEVACADCRNDYWADQR